MLAAEKLIRRGVENGVFPYAEWAAFDKDGIFSRGATAGEGGRRFDLASLTKTFTNFTSGRCTSHFTMVSARSLPLQA